MAWKAIEAQYSNPYPSQVTVTLKHRGTGQQQQIISNRIHPYFVQLPADVTQAVPNSEGHDYQGVIERGAWVDAQHLQAGYRLLNADNSWAEVVGVSISHEPLVAYNLTVADYHTYFVAGAMGAPAVWVHNDCWESLPDGYVANGKHTEYGQEVFQNTEGQLVYKGHDGRYYNAEKYPPSSTSPNAGVMPENITIQAQNGLPYTSNPKHTSGAPGSSGSAGSAAGIEPRDALELFNSSVQIKDKRYAVDSNGNIHQFTDTGSLAGWHWAGGSIDERAPFIPNNKIKPLLRKAFPEFSKNKTFKELTK